MPAKKKKTSKTKKVLNWLNPTSPVKGMLLFALAFAAIGGGYAAYRSFALTLPAHVIVHDANSITVLSGPAVKQTDSHGGLPNTTVWRLEQYTVVHSPFKIFATTWSINANVCTTYRFTYGSTHNVLGIAYTNYSFYNEPTGTYTYTHACKPVTIPLEKGQYNTVKFQVLNGNPFAPVAPTSGDLYVENIYLTW